MGNSPSLMRKTLYAQKEYNMTGGGTPTQRSLRGISSFISGGKSKPSPIPKDPDPVPTPESVDAGASASGERERLLARRRKGRRGTVLTENTFGDISTDRQSLLGNTGA